LRLTHIDDAQEMALIAQPSDKDDEIIGVARYAADRGSREAEFAVTVRSDRKGEGIGWVLTEALVAVARARGITKLTGLVLRANTSMLQFCRDYGFAIGVNPADPLSYRASLVLAPSESERTPQDS
jgi:acetyltransferase